MSLLPHLCEQRMYALTHLPTCFKYYSAIHLTKLHQIRFYTSYKRDAGFPLFDKTFRHIVQVKYYGPKLKIR